MSGERILLANPLQRNLYYAEKYGHPIAWGDLATMSQADLEAYGYFGARDLELQRQAQAEAERSWYAAQEKAMHQRYGSERLASSGFTEEMNRREAALPRSKRTLRREHYRRKAALEAKKEAARMARYAGLRASEVAKLEAARKTRKAEERHARSEAKRKIRAFLTRKVRK